MAEHCSLRLIGETRRATLEGGRLVAMEIHRDGDGVAAGTLVQARLAKKLGTRGIARAGAEELLVQPWPSGASEGATALLEITRAAWPEAGRERLGKARPARPGASPSPPVPEAPDHWPDGLHEMWDSAFEAAELGLLAFPGGRLVFAPTPALLAVDVDGEGAQLSTPALQALARAIRLWGLGGIIVIDVPHADRAARQEAATALDRAMTGRSFERTAINGFGLMELVVPRIGPSVLERARFDRNGTDAIRLLQAAAHDTGTGPMRLLARDGVARWLSTRPHLLAELARRTGRPVDVEARPGAGSGHVEAR